MYEECSGQSLPIVSGIRHSTLTDRLNEQKEHLENQLDRVNTALKLLEENPKLQKVFDAVSQLRIF